MTTIFISGIPGSNKSKVVSSTQHLCEKHLGSKIISILKGEIFSQYASELFNIEERNIPNMSYTNKLVFRKAALPEITLKILESKESEHAIIDSPVTVLSKEGITDIVMSAPQVYEINANRPLDFFVTLYDDPSKVSERLKGRNFPSDKDSILSWSATEVLASGEVLPFEISGKKVINQTPHYVFPSEYSELSLLKLIYDSSEQIRRKPTIAYSAGPISHMNGKEGDSSSMLKKKEHDMRKMEQFQKDLQRYAIVISPIKIADLNATDYNEKDHTVFRDLNWFVRKANCVIAYYPSKYRSDGTKAELTHALDMGKDVILIHPKEDDEVFGIRPTLEFRHPNEFFEAIERYKEGKYDNDPRYTVIRSFLTENLNSPRYDIFSSAIDEVIPSKR